MADDTNRPEGELRRAELDAEQTIADAQQGVSDDDQTAADADQSVADQASDRSDRDELRAKLAQTQFDELTGTYRRGPGKVVLQAEIDRAHRYGAPLVFQPITRLGSGEIEGFEALLRWNHPELGPISPQDFVPLAERSGVIVPIGNWVLDMALHALAGWRRLQPERELSVAVNVAPQQLIVGDFSRAVAAALDRAQLPATALTLEITERTLVADQPATRRTLEELRALGVRLSLDDFGTGFSSLGRLSSFPLDELKIDRVFIAGFEQQAQAALVAGIIAMAKALGLGVVAEGIETEAQRSALAAMECAHGQNYLLGRPIAERDVPTLLAPPLTHTGARRMDV